MFVKNGSLHFKYFNSIISKNSTEEQYIFAMKLPALSEHSNQVLDIEDIFTATIISAWQHISTER